MSSVSALNSLLSSASTSSSSSSGIDLSSLLEASTGASSVGIDVTSAVDAAIYAARAPERQWQAQQSTIQSQTSALSSVQSAISAVTTDLTNLNDPLGATSQRVVTSSNNSVVTGTATAATTTGSHTVQVNNLATTASWYSSPLAGATASVGSSVFQITTSGGTQTSFTLGSGGLTSLNALATAINGASLGINASVVTDTTGSRLSLVSQGTGAAKGFSVSDGAATAGTYTSASVANASTSLQASTLQLGDGNSTSTLSIAAGSTLSSVAAQINGAGLNLTAQVVTDNSGAHLSVAATGTGGQVTLSSDPTISLTQADPGKDASLVVDGVPVQSATNSVSSAISGVTLNLQGVSNGASVTLNVAADTDQITSSLSQFVQDYNSAVSLVNQQFTYSQSSGGQGVLGTDSTIRSLQGALLGITGYTAGTQGSSSSASLASLGITMNDDGTLSLDSSTLQAAVNTNPTAVQNYLQGTSLNGFAGSALSSLQTYSQSGSGLITVDSNNLTQQYNSLEDDINDYESGYIASQQTLLTTMYSNAEIALQQLPTTLKQVQAQLGNNSGN